jgi:serine/threonine protein kinase
MVDRQGHIRLVDFGLAKDLSGRGVPTTRSFCGTASYSAPELIACAPPKMGTRLATEDGYGRAVDWWAAGVLMFVMLCGHMPFEHENRAVLFDLICTKSFEVPPRLDAVTQSLIHALLTKDPVKR